MTGYGDAGLFYIPAAGVCVPLYLHDGNDQAIVDREESALLLRRSGGCDEIADHASQGFDRIKACRLHDIACIQTPTGTQFYSCIAITDGKYTPRDYVTLSGVKLSACKWADLCCITCNDDKGSIAMVFFVKAATMTYPVYDVPEGDVSEGDAAAKATTAETRRGGDDDMTAIDRLIRVAEGEIGYLEKKSNKDLDDKTANAGSANYTKYNRDMKAWAGSAGINDQWCQNFVDWCFVSAFGLEAARKLIHKFTNYTPTGSNAFKNAGQYIKRGKGTPRRGDVVYFYSSQKGRIGHVGIVYRVDGGTVYTVEGNTSGASALVTNGGGVRKKSYSLSSTYVDGYGRPDYSEVDLEGTGMTVGERELRNGDEGADVKEMQAALISLGFDCGSYGADGEFGDCTEMAVRSFQAKNGLAKTGVYDAATRAAMKAALEGENVQAEPGAARYVEIAKSKQCYVRAAPNTGGKILGVARSGDRLRYHGQDSADGWHLVEWKGKDGWVSGKYGRLVI